MTQAVLLSQPIIINEAQKLAMIALQYFEPYANVGETAILLGSTDWKIQGCGLFDCYHLQMLKVSAICY